MLKQPGNDKLIGEILVAQSIITPEQLSIVLAEQKQKYDFIYAIVIKLGFAKVQEIFKALSKQIGVPYVELSTQIIDSKAVEKVPARIALHYELMPFCCKNNRLSVALADPLAINKLDDLRLLLNMEIEPFLGYEGEILETIQKYYGVGADILEEIMARQGASEKLKVKTAVIEDLEDAAEDASIIKFVNQILSQAVDERATDIHLEPYKENMRIRFRIDGLLYEVPIPDTIKLFHSSIISRVKIMASLDIAEHRQPQDGRIKIKVKNQELDLRVSVLPAAFGESVQIRILSPESFLSLKNLGLFEDDFNRLIKLINKPYGILFVTGPTGSGKSTTLYGCLNEKNTSTIKIITIEDPIEYQMRGITQIQSNSKIGFGFAQGLRSILRHDPDIIMVGEVRDCETAEITIRSAMTGHLVFSTLHTNDAFSAPTRLIDMGIESYLVASSLEGIIAQRLVRTICHNCKQEITVPAQIFIDAGLPVKGSSVTLQEGKGCDYCRGTGYRGRTAIFEIMLIDDEIRDLIFKKVTSHTIKEKILAKGCLSLRQDGLRKTLQGITTLQEVMRVT